MHMSIVTTVKKVGNVHSYFAIDENNLNNDIELSFE
jgi:hypothetical protein